ncbi:uncharacterized protein [Parasteatoda tepidariorum]|uniref:uncharacterized protein n=1 Tax=Parasteatoda tepidariorum TaxID=114398 RepID=UPI00077F9A5C|nr:uncharacterized protein LOC107454011 [Parasteatoda tepidariorum]
MAKTMYLVSSIIICFAGFIASLTIVAPECNPPDFPAGGGYGPIQEYYVVGDVIYYYCETTSYIGGNFFRRCEDDGDWIGDTPVCDFPAEMSITNQSSTEEPKEENEALLASDGDQTTCSSTTPGRDSYWMGMFQEPGELIRIMIFMPQGEIAYKVVLLKSNGITHNCGSERDSNSPIGWKIHNCPSPENRNTIGIQIKSLSSKPLHICEVRAYLLTTPTCVDPHLHINYGRIQLTRKTAELVCEKGFIRSPDELMTCIRGNVWNEKNLYCQEQLYDLGEKENPPDNEP